MKRTSLAVIAFLFASIGVQAQSGMTNAHAVVLDPSGTPYANCSGSASFVPSPSATQAPTIGGSAFPTTAVIASCDSFGAFSLKLADNNAVVDGHTSPPASQWRFAINAQGGTPGFQCTLTITGPSQDISAPLQACSAPLPAGGGGAGNSFVFSQPIQSATPSFAGNQDTAFFYLLNQSVTSSTFIPTVKPGLSPVFYVDPCQDSVGGWNMTWPPNVILPANYTFNKSAGTCSPVAFVYNPNTHIWSPWMNLTTGGGGGTTVSLQTNSVVNALQTVLNLISGSGIGLVADGSGGVTISNTSTANTVSTTLTTNVLPKANGANSIIDSSLSDDATTVATAEAFKALSLQATGISGSVQCVHADASGNLTGVGFDCGSGGGTPAGNDGDLQMKSGTNFAASNLNQTGTTLTINDESVFCGTNPYLDIRCLGARKLATGATPAIPGVTAAITSTSNSAVISTQLCPGQAITTCFLQADGITIGHAGIPHSMTTPAAPTLTQVDNGVMTGVPLETVNAPTGAITYNAQIFEFNKFGGYTAASSTATITTSNTLGMQHVNIATCQRTNSTVACVTSTPHGLRVGCTATPSTSANRCPTVLQNLTNMTDVSFAGEKAIQSVADTTHYTYLDNQDTRNGASAAVATGGILYWGQAVHYAMPTHSADGLYWAACSDRASPGVFTVVGITWPKQAAGFVSEGVSEFNDWGAAMGAANGSPTIPWYIPTTCPSTSASNNLTTTVTGVAGTTLTLASNAGTSCAPGACSIVVDTAPLLAGIPNNNYPVYFPPSGSTSTFYVFNSSVDFSTVPVGPFLVGGWARINAPFMLGSASTWIGTPFPSGRDSPSFTYGSYPVISCNAKPCIWFAQPGGGAGEFGNFELTQGGSQNISIMQDGEAGGAGVYLHDLQSGLGNDLMGIAFVCRSSPVEGCPVHGTNISFTANNAPTDGTTFTPLMILNGESRFDQFTMAGRGIFTRFDASIGFTHMQGGIEPLITVTGNASGGNEPVSLQLGWNGGIEMDTIAHAVVSYQPGLGSAQVGVDYAGASAGPGPSSGVGFYTGQRIYSSNLIGSQNRDTRGTDIGTCNDATFVGGANQVVDCFNDQHNVNLELTPAYSFFTDTPPNTVTCAVSAGGGVTIGSQLQFRVSPVWSNGAEGNISFFTPVCPTSGGNQTVTLNWTQLSAVPTSWNIYERFAPGNGSERIRNTGGVGATSCNSGQVPGATLTITLIADTNCGVAPASNPAGGPVWAKSTSSASDTFTIGNYEDYTGVTAPANPPAGRFRTYVDTGTGKFSCKDSVGASCAQSGTVVNTITGDGTLINNSGSSGPVTLTLGSAGAFNLWFNNTAGSAIPTYVALSSFPTAQFPTLNQNTTGSAADLTGCGGASAGDICVYDTGTWTKLAGNVSGTQVLTENASGVASWGSGASTAFQANGTPLTSAATVNFQNSSATNGQTFTFSNPSAGNVKLGVTGTLDNAGLTNSATTVNSQTCTLGSTCTIPFQTNTVSNTSQAGINLIPSTVNSMGITVTPTNTATNQDTFEATGTVNATSGGTGQNLSASTGVVQVAAGAFSVSTGLANGTTATLQSCADATTKVATDSFVATCGLINPMTTIGDMIGGGASGISTRIVGGKTGQSIVATNAATPGFASGGVGEGNAGSAVTTTPYVVLCDSATAQRDRLTVLRIQTGGSVVTNPDHTATGSRNNFAYTVFADGVTVTVNRSGSDTFSVFDGSAATDGATSFTLLTGQYATINNGTGTVWEVRKTPSSVGSVTSIATTTPITGGTITTTGTISCPTCVTSAASLTSTALVTGGGSQASQTPSATTTLDSSGNLLAAGNVDGTAPVTVTTGASATLGGTFKSGYTFNQNATAATAITYTLPTAAAGRQYCVANSFNGSAPDTGTIELLTSASGQFIIFTDGTLTATGGFVQSTGAARDAACVVGVDATHWMLYVNSGSWTKH